MVETWCESRSLWPDTISKCPGFVVPACWLSPQHDQNDHWQFSADLQHVGPGELNSSQQEAGWIAVLQYIPVTLNYTRVEHRSFPCLPF